MPSILRLHLWGCPSAVIRRVRAIVVNSVYGVIDRRALSHVGVERLKGLSPSVTDSDSSAAVIRPTFTLGVVASSFHSAPHIPFRRHPRLACHAMRSPTYPRAFIAEASATGALSITNGWSKDRTNYAAVASAYPVTTFSAPNDGPSTKSSPSQFYKRAHDVKFTTETARA